MARSAKDIFLYSLAGREVHGTGHGTCGGAIDVTSVLVRIPQRERPKVRFANLTALTSMGNF